MTYEEFWNKFIEIFYAKRTEIKFLLQYLELVGVIEETWQNKPELNIEAIEGTEITAFNLKVLKSFTLENSQFPVRADLGNYYNPMMNFYFEAYKHLAKEPSTSNVAVKAAVEQKLKSIKEILEAIKPQLIDAYVEASGEDLEGWEQPFMRARFEKGGRVVKYGGEKGDTEPVNQMLYEALNLQNSHALFVSQEAERLSTLRAGK